MEKTSKNVQCTLCNWIFFYFFYDFLYDSANLNFSIRINMYSEGLIDLMEMMMMLAFTADPKPKLDNIQSKAKERYLPVFEKV